MILSLPLFLMFFVNIMASFIYWKEPLNANDLLKFNHEFIFWCSIVGVISLSVVFSGQIMISYYVDKINTLDQENENYKNAKKELEQTKKVYLKLIEEINPSNDNEDIFCKTVKINSSEKPPSLPLPENFNPSNEKGGKG